jgi:hypothetical protein
VPAVPHVNVENEAAPGQGLHNVCRAPRVVCTPTTWRVEKTTSAAEATTGADGPDKAAEAKWEAALKEAASRIEAAEAKSAAALKEAASRIEAAEAKSAAALKEAASRIEFAEAATAKAAATLKEAAARIEAAVTNAAKSEATGGGEVLGGKRPQVEGGEGVDAKRLKTDV